MQPDAPEPWRSFLIELDGLIPALVQWHCCGGFVVTALYGLPRPTADIDVLAVVPSHAQKVLGEIAGKGSKLHEAHGVYVDIVTVATCPDRYDERLIEMYPGTLRKIRLLALDPYDLALAKLTRNADRDRSDVEYLGVTVPLDVLVLRERYESEMRTYSGRPEREDLTLELWIEIIQEAQRKRGA